MQSWLIRGCAGGDCLDDSVSSDLIIPEDFIVRRGGVVLLLPIYESGIQTQQEIGSVDLEPAGCDEDYAHDWSAIVEEEDDIEEGKDGGLVD